MNLERNELREKLSGPVAIIILTLYAVAFAVGYWLADNL